MIMVLDYSGRCLHINFGKKEAVRPDLYLPGLRMCHRPGLQRCSKYPGRREADLPDIFERSHGKNGRSNDPAGSCKREKTKEKEGCIKSSKIQIKTSRDAGDSLLCYRRLLLPRQEKRRLKGLKLPLQAFELSGE